MSDSRVSIKRKCIHSNSVVDKKEKTMKQTFCLFPPDKSSATKLYSLSISTKVVLVKKECSEERKASLFDFGRGFLSHLKVEELSKIVKLRFEDACAFNKPEYSKLQLASFIMSDSTSFWNSKTYEENFSTFCSVFPINAKHHQARIIASGDILAIMNGIDNILSLEGTSGKSITWDEYNSGFTLIVLLLLDIFVHRKCRVIYHEDSLKGFGLKTSTFSDQTYTGLPNRVPNFGPDVVATGLALPTVYSSHSVIVPMTSKQKQLFGTFGLVHYVNSTFDDNECVKEATCSFNIISDVAVMFTNVDGTYTVHREQLLFVEELSNGYSFLGELLFFYKY